MMVYYKRAPPIPCVTYAGEGGCWDSTVALLKLLRLSPSCCRSNFTIDFTSIFASMFCSSSIAEMIKFQITKIFFIRIPSLVFMKNGKEWRNKT